MSFPGFEEFLVDCPHCGETVEVSFEEDVEGELVVDCQVCCRPWRVRLTRAADGTADLEVEAGE